MDRGEISVGSLDYGVFAMMPLSSFEQVRHPRLMPPNRPARHQGAGAGGCQIFSTSSIRTLMPPFNTAIVNGFNAATGSKVKLGRWDHYFAMRAGTLRLNQTYRDLLSNDLGAIAGVLFDVGIGRFATPPAAEGDAAHDAWFAELSKTRETAKKLEASVTAARQDDLTHSRNSGMAKRSGPALGYKVWVAANDRGRSYDGGKLATGCVDFLPSSVEGSTGVDSIRLIDILWIDPEGERVTAAFEAEHTTSIYSGIVRMLDLALSSGLHVTGGLFLVARRS